MVNSTRHSVGSPALVFGPVGASLRDFALCTKFYEPPQGGFFCTHIKPRNRGAFFLQVDMKNMFGITASLLLIAVLLMLTIGIVGAGICFWIDLVTAIVR